MERGSPLRQPSSPLRTNNRLRLCAYVSPDDINTERVQLSAPASGCNQAQINIAGSTKSHSKSAFENVFTPDISQNDIATSLLPELLHTFFNGNDCSFLSFGGKSKGKTSLLYGNGPQSPGMVHTAVEAVFNMIEECRAKRADVRLQLRLSALHYSQRENTLTDLLSTFNPDPRRRPVRIAEDSRFGTLDIENESLIKVESAEQALFYLNSVIDHRLVEDEETYRTNHLFIFFSLYGYKTNGAELEGGRRRFCLADVGIGERNSQKGELTMPVIGSILLALFQGQKHLPSRDNTLCQLIRCGLYSSRLSTVLCTFASKTDDNENILQLASKLARVRRNRVHIPRHSADACSSVSGKRSELESGSEMSTVDTVIYMGPSSGTSSRPRTLHRSPKIIPPRSPSQSSKVTQTSDSSTRTCSTSIPPMLQGHTPFLSATLRLYNDLCSPPGTSYDVTSAFGGKCNENRDDFGITIAPPKKQKNRPSMDDEKRLAIIDWIEQCDHGSLCLDEDRFYENGSGVKECIILSHPLEDIIELDEESLKESLRSRRDSHPLRVLSKEGIDKIEIVPQEKPALVRCSNGPNGFAAHYLHDSDEDALERAMEASVSSMRSHEILSRLHNQAGPEAVLTKQNSEMTQGVSLTTGTPSEMDLYRRASQLEEYAMQRVKEIEEEKTQKKNKLLLNCCQASMLSSSSTVVDSHLLEKRQKEKEEEEKRRDELKARRQQLKLEESELRKERQMIDKQLDGRSLPSALMRQITYQLHNLAVNKNSAKMRGASDSLPSTPTITHKKINPPCRTPSLTNCSSLISTSQPTTSIPKITKREGSHSRKTSKSREKRDRRNSEDKDEIRSPYAKVTSPRIGNGPSSSGRGSDAGDDPSAMPKNRKRQSYSASSGYESGAGDYHTYHKDSRFDRLRVFDKKLNLGREADNLKETQRRLKKELTSAKQRIGQTDDARLICHDSKHSGISQATLVDTLMQENRILEKRLVACQNHIMLVTSFL